MLKRHIHKWAFVLCFAAILVFATQILAAPGDEEYYAYLPSEPHAIDAIQSVAYDDAVYFIGVIYGDGIARSLMRWAPGMEMPETVLALPQESGAYSETSQGTQSEEVPKAGAYFDTLVAGDNALWGVNFKQGTVSKLVDTTFIVLPVRLEDTKQLAEGYCILGAFVRDNILYALRSDEDGRGWGQNNALLAFDLDTGAHRLIPAGSSASIIPFKAGQALVREWYYDAQGEQTANLAVIELATGKMIKLPQSLIASNHNSGGLAYDAESDTIYYLAESRLWRSSAEADFEPVAYLPTSSIDARSDGVLLPGGLYAITPDGRLIVRNIDPQYMPDRVLSVLGSWGNDLHMAFLRDHPEIPVMLIDSAYTNSMEISQAINTGDSSIDVFRLTTENGLRALIDKGYTADLTASEKLREDVAQMYPAIQRAITGKDGKVYAYPVNMWIEEGFQVDLPLWESFGFGDIPKTWDELLDGLLLWEQKYADENEDVVYLMNGFTKSSLRKMVLDHFIREFQHDDAPVDFTNPFLRGVLEKIEQLPYGEYDLNNMTEKEREAYHLRYQSRALLWPNVAISLRDPAGERLSGLWRPEDAPERPEESLCSISVPVFDLGHEPKLSCSLGVVFVNPLSENTDLAIDYIEYMMENADAELRYLLHPGLSEPVRDPAFEMRVEETKRFRADLQERFDNVPENERQVLRERLAYYDNYLANLDLHQWLVSPRGLEDYRRIANTLWVDGESSYFSSEGLNSLQQIIMEMSDRYDSGQISMDIFLKELNNKTHMIYLEGQ